MFSEGYFKAGVFTPSYFARGEALTVKAGRSPRRIDFEPANWAEFGAGPFEVSSGGSHVALSLESGAALPDRPITGGVGMSVVMSAGGISGAYVEVDFGDVHDVAHVRSWMNVTAATGGDVEVIRLLDELSQPIGDVTFDAVSRVMRVTLLTGETISTTLTEQLAWQCIEVSYDRIEQSITLWINGFERASAEVISAMPPCQRMWVGGVSKDSATTGVIWMDELAVDVAYIGSRVHESASAHAEDPARWAVIYNSDDSDSTEWAGYYRAARGVPYANLIGLPLSTNEVIDKAAYQAMTEAIADYLARNDLSNSVMGVILGYRVPGTADFFGSMEATAGLLQTADIGAGVVDNPVYSQANIARPTMDSLGGVRLTARIDGPSLAHARGLVDRATRIMADGLGDGLTSRVWVEPIPGGTVSGVPGAVAMEDWPGELRAMRTRLPLERPSVDGMGDPLPVEVVDRDGFYWGIQVDEAPFGFFGADVGERVCCAQWQPGLVTGGTLRSVSPTQWLGRALAAGYASGIGSTRPISPSAIAHIGTFFDALRLGWTLGEAWMVSAPLLREAVYLAGDPLMTVALPKAGWDVFGPLATMERMNLDAPSVLLRADETSLAIDAPLQVNEGQEGVYVIRRVDEQGRSELGVKTAQVARVAMVNGQSVAPPMMPVWPVGDGWRAVVESGEVRLEAVWERPAKLARITKAIIEARTVASGAIAQIATITPDAHARVIQAKFPRPAEATRYRWYIESAGGAQRTSGWSAAITGGDVAVLALEVVEG